MEAQPVDNRAVFDQPTAPDADALIEEALEQAVAFAISESGANGQAAEGPAKLTNAIRHALFPGGARVRPKLCLAVAGACGERDPLAALGAAAAIELLHCASLVHDDLPCFDDAGARRGKPSVHRTYGEALAVLAGDAMIVMSYQALVRASAGDRLAKLLDLTTRTVAPPHGIIAGQAWESEAEIDLRAYHRAKTGSLFVAATTAGAASVGDDPEHWRALGERLGEAYQIADDIRDCFLDEAELGKPKGQDARCARPNAVDSLGRAGAEEQLFDLIQDAANAVPDCAGAQALRELVFGQHKRLMFALNEQRVF